MRNIISILFSLLILTSCISEQHDIIVKGRIFDAETNAPIPNAEVVALCWYQNNIDDVTFNKQKTNTDNQGNYKLSFDIGYKIDIASKTAKHSPNRAYNELKDNTLNVDLSLEPKKIDNSLIVNLTTMRYAKKDEAIPYLRQRVYSNPTTDELDFSNIESWGYDFINSKNSPNTDSTDIWLSSVSKEEHPTTLLTSPDGGLVPIYSKDVKSSLLFEKKEAPLDGYITEYRLQGNEEGFFVKCRDGLTYAKLIMEKSKIDKSSPSTNGYYKEWGYNFGSMYQTGGSRSFDYNQDIDLEQFLVDYRYR